jgi:D-3-phosphoglycerate dehydrogenase
MAEHSFPKSEIKVALLENIHQTAVKAFEDEGFQVQKFPKALSEAELIERLSDVHLLGIRSKTQVSEKYLASAKRLLSVGCFCIGTNQVDVAAAMKMGVPVFNAPFSNTRSVAELIMAEIVMLSRKLGDQTRAMHQGRWIKSASGCYEIRGKVLGIVGYGHIGSQVGVLAESFGMQVLFYDIVTKMPMGNCRAVSSLEQLLEQSDFVSFHVPETDLTRNMMGEAQFLRMKKGSYLLNASRGTVVDLHALHQHLGSGRVAGAALDVFPEEPEGSDTSFKHELQNLGNVILTPHIGGSTEEAQYNIGIEVSTALKKFLNNGNSSGAVNFPIVDLPHQKETHRIFNVHKNVPGVLRDINSIVSEVGANIQAQYLSTNAEIGYLIMDVDRILSEQVKKRIQQLEANIKTRILY